MVVLGMVALGMVVLGSVGVPLFHHPISFFTFVFFSQQNKINSMLFYFTEGLTFIFVQK
jgi:hypothetical protein